MTEVNKINPVILLRYIDNSANITETELVENWLLQNDENERILLKIAEIHYAQRTIVHMQSWKSENSFEKLKHHIHPPKLWRPYLSKIAAFITGAIITAGSMFFLNKENNVSESLTQYITIEANAGMRTHCNLPDGTVAHLNSGSKLIYPIPYAQNERKVRLIGEAYFHVSPNQNKPFIVSVLEDKMRVKVLGTEFNIQAFVGEETVQTTLVNGSVNLEFQTNIGTYKEQKLVPSEKATYNITNDELSIKTVDTQYETSWRHGRLMFKNTSLPEVLRKLAHFYNVKFEVKDSMINSYTFTGTFENKQLSQILDYLRISSNINSKINQSITVDSNDTMQNSITLWKKY